MQEQHPFQMLRIDSIREELPGFKTISFKDAHRITYKAGQYLTLLHPLNANIRRSYSMISTPVQNEPLAIGVKRVANGSFSRWLVDEAAPGDLVQTIGAGGRFLLPQSMQGYQQLFFFAAGSGITPIFSLLKTALHLYPHISLVLIYSNASPSKTIFLKELQELEKNSSGRLQIVFLFSNAVQLDKARLHRDLLLQLVSALSINHAHEHLYYLCGPEAYMRLCSYTLQETGIPKEHIRKENFISESIRSPTATPPDKASYYATISYGASQHHIRIDYPLSILDAALQQGLLLPYSCKAGRCGNCVARCTQGTVWHSYNEVLTEKELATGLMLTCTGHPVGGDVVLSIGG